MSVAPPAPATTVNENSAIYYSGQYWNDLPQVVAYMPEDLTGDPATWWVRDFQEGFCSGPPANGPVVNCGNGCLPAEGRPAGHGAVALLPGRGGSTRGATAIARRRVLVR